VKKYIFIIPFLFMFQGCSLLALAALSNKDEPVVKETVEYVTQEINCGIPPNVDALHLQNYEPIVLPSLSTLGVSIDNMPEYLVDHYDHGWMALSMSDWEDIDTNDIDKKRLTLQWMEVVKFYQKCIEDYGNAGSGSISNDTTE